MTARAAIPLADIAQVVVVCPGCGQSADIGVTLRVELLVVQGNRGQLRARLKSKPVDHHCGQLRIPDAPDPEDPAQLGLDWGRLAAGEGVAERVNHDPVSVQ